MKAPKYVAKKKIIDRNELNGKRKTILRNFTDSPEKELTYKKKSLLDKRGKMERSKEPYYKRQSTYRREDYYSPNKNQYERGYYYQERRRDDYQEERRGRDDYYPRRRRY